MSYPVYFLPPNTISQETKEFYISFNASDNATAIVIGEQMDYCYILKGDHRKAYKAIGDNLNNCIEYFQANNDKITDTSDRVGELSNREKVAILLKKLELQGK